MPSSALVVPAEKALQYRPLSAVSFIINLNSGSTPLLKRSRTNNADSSVTVAQNSTSSVSVGEIG